MGQIWCGLFAPFLCSAAWSGWRLRYSWSTGLCEKPSRSMCQTYFIAPGLTAAESALWLLPHSQFTPAPRTIAALARQKSGFS